MITLSIVLGVTLLGLCGLLAAGVAMWRLDVNEKNAAQQRALTLREELDRSNTRMLAAQARAALAETQLATAVERNLKEMHALKAKTMEALATGNPGDRVSAGVGVWARPLPGTTAADTHDRERSRSSEATLPPATAARADTSRGVGDQ